MNTTPAPQPPRQILVSVPLANALLEYLQQRPYREVAQLISGLQSAPAAEVVQKDKEA